MNIFFTDEDPIMAARALGDKHVLKMIVETAQILSTARFINGSWNEELYRPTHDRHPSVLWAAGSSDSYGWLTAHLRALVGEYGHRWGGTHATSRLIGPLSTHDHGFDPCVMEPPPVVTAEPYRGLSDDPVTCYRLYYAGAKTSCHRWTRREPPSWLDASKRLIASLKERS